MNDKETATNEASNSRDKLAGWLLVMFVVVTIVNFGSRFFPDGENQFVNTPPTRINAAGFAFPIIWSVIFFGMIGFAAWLRGRLADRSSSLNKAIVCLMIAGAASIAFVPISLYTTYTLGWIDILVHLVALVAAQFFLRRHVRRSPALPSASGWPYWVPSIYLGWICAATAISSALALREQGILIDPELATLVTLSVLGCLTIVGALMIEQRDGVFGLTLAWAFLAIGVQQTKFPKIQMAAFGAAATLTVMAGTAWWLQRFHYATNLASEK
jgi:tryptophan-rich sensory protein